MDTVGGSSTPSRRLSIMDRLAERVMREITDRQLIARGQRVLVGLSAGPDSSVLLHLLVQLTPRGGWQVAAAHLHHGLRGSAADADCRRAEELARQLGVPFFARHVDVAELAQRESLSLEDAGRRARYRFFRELVQTEGFDRVALGHQLNDQAETVLLHLLQGSGRGGLAGMAWYRAPCYIRPLLSTSREEIERYLAEWGWRPARDATNSDVRYLRNRLRYQLLPLLQREYAPGLSRRLAQLAEIVRAEDDFLDSQLDAAWPDLKVQRVFWPPGWSVDAPGWERLPVALRRRACRRLLALAGGTLMDLTSHPSGAGATPAARAGERALASVPRSVGYRSVLAMSAVPLPTPVQLPRGWRWEHRPDLGQYRLEQPAEYVAPCIKLPLPGEVTWSWVGRSTQLRALRLVHPPSDGSWSRDRYRPHLAEDSLRGELRVRPWRSGDRLQPLGLSGHKKVHDLFVDAKVPRWQRASWPIVCDERGIVWVPGLALAERVRVRPTSRHWLQLEWVRTPSQPVSAPVL